MAGGATPIRGKGFRARAVVRPAALLAIAAWNIGAAEPPDPAASAASFDRLAWRKAETAHFTAYSQLSEYKTRRSLAEFEQFRDFLDRAFPDQRREDLRKTYVLAFTSESAYRPYAKRNLQGVPQDVGGFFISTPAGNFITIEAGPRSAFRPVVYHEYMHHFLTPRYGALPLWCEEGLAEYFGFIYFAGANGVAGSEIEHHVETLRETGLLPLTRLFGISAYSGEYDEIGRAGPFYGTSWLLVHYLLSDAGGKPLGVEQLLAMAAQPGALQDSILAHLGVSVDTLQSRLEAYLDRRVFKTATYSAGKAISLDSIDVQPAGRVEVATRLAELLVFAHEDSASAAAHLAEVAGEEGAGAETAAIGAYTTYAAGDPAAAETQFKSATESYPQDPWVWQLYALSRLRTFQRESGTIFRRQEEVPAKALEARAFFERSLELQPGNPDALYGLGSTYLNPGNEDTAPGIAALEQARELFGGQLAVTTALASLYSNSGEIERADALLRDIRRKANKPDLVNRVENILLLGRQERANDLFRAGRYDEALSTMRSIVDGLPAGPGKEVAQENLELMKAQAVNHRCVARFNAALDLLKAGKTREGRAGMLPLKEECTEPSLADRIAEILAATAPRRR
ncbi:hypothetical protein ABI59_08675 [Acidobacteria bacterium Mor1]|nr:hypothetical protein ABI59_08675 [Acidobacteria bacterium Mor1]